MEILGEIFRIPFFKKYSKKGFKVFQLKDKNNVSDSILIDEYASIGGALLGNLFERFSFKRILNLEKIKIYNFIIIYLQKKGFKNK